MSAAVPGQPPKADLATVRRFEAAGFRAWPASAVHYDGTWVVRLTAGHPAKRLNSVNPLDPGDVHNLPERIARAGRRFEAYGRPLTFRMSPLSGAALSRHLDGEGWASFSESLVMQLALDDDVGPRRDGPDPDEGHGPLRRRGDEDPWRRPGAAARPLGDHRRDPAGGRAVRARARGRAAGDGDLRA